MFSGIQLLISVQEAQFILAHIRIAHAGIRGVHSLASKAKSRRKVSLLFYHIQGPPLHY